MIFYWMPGLLADANPFAIHANRDELLQRHELADGCQMASIGFGSLL
jgi:hypothetical protein